MADEREKVTEDEEPIYAINEKSLRLKLRDGWSLFVLDRINFIKLWVHYPNLPDKIPAVLSGFDAESNTLSVRLVINGVCIERAVDSSLVSRAKNNDGWSTWTRIMEVPDGI